MCLKICTVQLIWLQIRKNKTKIEKKNRIKSGAGKLFTDAVVEEATTTEKVVRSKTIDLEPMDLDEAILQMDLLAHDFFIYRDAEDNTTNVIYRREDGDIGLLEVKEQRSKKRSKTSINYRGIRSIYAPDFFI